MNGHSSPHQHWGYIPRSVVVCIATRPHQGGGCLSNGPLRASDGNSRGLNKEAVQGISGGWLKETTLGFRPLFPFLPHNVQANIHQLDVGYFRILACETTNEVKLLFVVLMWDDLSMVSRCVKCWATVRWLVFLVFFHCSDHLDHPETTPIIAQGV